MGEVNGVKVKVVRDTGCGIVGVRESLVDKECVTNETVTCILFDGERKVYRVGYIHVKSPYFTGMTKAALLKNPHVDLNIGNIKGATMGDGYKGVRPIHRGRGYSPGPNTTIKQNHINANWNKDSHRFTKITKEHSSKGYKIENIGTEVVAGAVTTRAQKNNPKQYSSTVKRHLTEFNIQPEDYKRLQAEDVTLRRIHEHAKKRSMKGTEKSLVKYKGGLLMREYNDTHINPNISQEQLVAPKVLRKTILEIAHDNSLSAHMGIARTKERVLKEFWWPGIASDVRHHCRTCDACQKVKKSAGGIAPLGDMELITKTWSKVAVDLIGPIIPTSRKGYKYILTLVDTATRWPEAKPLKKIDAEEIQEALLGMFTTMGLPDEILSDNGTQFRCDLMAQVCKLMGITQRFSTPLHPQSNGMVERFNGTLKTLLIKASLEQPKDWEDHVQGILFAYREGKHESTGFSPFELMFGRKVRGPINILRNIFDGSNERIEGQKPHEYLNKLRDRLRVSGTQASKNLKAAKEKQKLLYDRRARKREILVGSRVVVMKASAGSKLQRSRWHGPYKVIEKVGDCNYVILEKGKRKTYHINLLEEYHSREESSQKHTETCTNHPITNSSAKNAAYAVVIEDNETENESRNISSLPTQASGVKESMKDVRINPHLKKYEREQIERILDKYANVITNTPGKSTVVAHSIELNTEKPICLRPYPIPFSAKQEIIKEIRQMEGEGIIEKSTSPYSSPIVLVKKKDGSTRFCIDYRKLNAITITDAEPIPNQEDLFIQLGQAKYFSKIDLVKGYWQLPVEINSRKYTAFQTDLGLYQFKYMPFGLCNAPATFARGMRRVLGDQKNVVSFFDDICVFGRSITEHNHTLDQVLNRLKTAGLTARPTKMEIGFSEIEFLGHIVGGGTQRPNASITSKILNIKPPNTKKQVRSLLGLISYYRKFVPDFADISASLSDLTKKGKPEKVQWTSTCREALEKIQKALSTQPILILPEINREFVIRTDASESAIGGCLMQEREGLLHPIAYVSRKLLSRETRYSVIEKECLGVVWTITKFSRYLFGNHFTIETDHKPLTVLQTSKSINNRVARWALTLQEYKFTIRPIPGADNTLADVLSRQW